ncbi:MAG TPA: VOC family protein [Thermomicrobiales bacterium]|nr:VOC family protein [Thermomicrobiales bacterium]
MVSTQPASATDRTSIHPDTTVNGPVSLTVADLDRSLQFYTGPIGLALLERNGGEATLGVPGNPLLYLVEQRGARPWTEYSTGLYHFAILLPTRADLGRWVRNWYDHGMPDFGQGDHLVSEALYLRDPDGHGIEIYRDRPRSEWQWQNGRVQMASLPVDVAGLLAEAERSGVSWSGAPAGTTMGHVHLQVGDIGTARAFYTDVLGFDVVAAMPTALFVSAGGYHHHLGMNTWHSRGGSPADPDVAQLRSYTIVLPNEDALADIVTRLNAAGYPTETADGATLVRDPWSNLIRLRTR